MQTETQNGQTRLAPPVDLPSLTGMRGIAAFLVFGTHFLFFRFATPVGSPESQGSDVFLGDVFGAAQACMTFFFVLSGFVLTWVTPAGMSAGRFWWRRFAKIYPVAIVTTVAAFVLFGLVVGTWPGWKVFLTNAFLLQAWVPDQAFSLGLNPVMWSLSCEAFFYFLFPFLMVMLGRATKRALLWTAGLCVTATAVLPWLVTKNFDLRQPEPMVLAPLEGFDNGFSAWFTSTFPLMRLFEFILGITIALLVRKGFRFGVNVPVALVASVAVYAISPEVPAILRSSAILVIPFGLLIAALAKADLSSRWSPVRSAPVVFFGKISYSFYAVHVLFVVFTVIHVPGPTGAFDRPRQWLAEAGLIDSPVVALSLWANLALFVVYLAVATLAAWILHTVVEVPLTRILRNVGRRETPTTKPPEPELVLAASGTGPDRLPG